MCLLTLWAKKKPLEGVYKVWYYSDRWEDVIELLKILTYSQERKKDESGKKMANQSMKLQVSMR